MFGVGGLHRATPVGVPSVPGYLSGRISLLRLERCRLHRFLENAASQRIKQTACPDAQSTVAPVSRHVLIKSCAAPVHSGAIAHRINPIRRCARVQLLKKHPVVGASVQPTSIYRRSHADNAMRTWHQNALA
jgi:hypothetical protein